MKTLEKFQEDGVSFLTSRAHAALGDEPGLGKTVQAIHAAERLGVERVLVTCPASVRSNWLDHVEEHFGHTRGWQIVSYNQVEERAGDAPFDLCILDEVHFCKTPGSQRTQAVFGKDGVARRARRVWCLSGTLAPNFRPVELWPMLKTLAPNFRDPALNYDKFVQRYCGAFWDGHGLNVKGATRVEELSRLMDGFLLRRTKKEVYPNRRAPIVSLIPVDLAPLDMKDVRRAEDEIEQRPMRISSRYDDFSALGDTSRLLRLLGEAMVPHVCRFVDDLLESREKVVVFFHHVDVGEQLREHFDMRGLGPVVYQGGMSDARKDAVVKLIETDAGTRIFLGQRQAAGTGINGLQRASSACVVAEPSWIPGETEQLIDRLDRIGQTDELVNAYVMYARSTLQAAVVTCHARKEAVGTRLFAPAAVDVLDGL